jgi:hypothetical protein
MAIARGAGTEIIRSTHMTGVNSSTRQLIFGEQHHIYTVLSVTAHAASIQAAGNWVRLVLLAYDTLNSAAGGEIHIFQEDMQTLETYVWNDKFSFGGHEASGFSGEMDSIVKQDQIADQAGSNPQKLVIYSQHASDNFDVTCTFIDQNNE